MHRKPNILVFMTDQQHVATSRAEGPCRTPHLDRLAAGGCRFTHAFTPTPICTPARSCFQTGLLPHQHKLLHNAHRGKGLHILGDFLPGTRVLGGALRDAGYRSAYFGKWDSGLEHEPDRHGYELYRGGNDLPAGPGSDDVRSEFVRIPGENDERRSVVSCTTTRSPEDSAPFRIAAAVEEFLDNPSGDNRPFFIFASCTEPHVPWICPREYAGLYDPADIPEPPSYRDTFEGRPASYLGDYNLHNYCHLPGDWPSMAQALAHYYGVVSMIDDALGRMLESLERRGLIDDTLVLFTSDHGEHMGAHGLVGKNCNLLDELVRIPLVIACPDRFKPQTSEALVSLTDGYATLLDVAGASESAPPASRSLTPLLRGEATDRFPDRMVMEHHGTFFLECVRGIRTRRYKYVFRSRETDELYDLQTDPWEMRNRIGDPVLAATLAELRAELLAYMETHQDPAARGMRVLLERQRLDG